MNSHLKKLFLISTLVTLPVFAQDLEPVDSAALSEDGFVQEDVSQGVVIRVPINESGEENASRAELRLDKNRKMKVEKNNILKTWKNSQTVDASKSLNENEPVDSSTCGWWGYRSQNVRWAPAYTYYHYTPTFYNYGITYSYDYSFSYTTESYRYYYYRRPFLRSRW